ncbi:MAG: hybrid sensor histidine kinase/response regulator [bacterium]|nr:hybrid sensor histidine kinase/response regulator [bacterium]
MKGEDLSQGAAVLVVDDNPVLLQVVSEVLKLDGLSVRTATGAEEALNLLKSYSPDIIVCDVMMPNVDGYAFHTEVQKNEYLCEVPFIFLTALSSSDNIRLGRERGCDEYLTKPFEPLDLLAVIKGKLSLSRVRRNSQEVRLEKYRRKIIQTLSHEFRTPLVAISTGTELLIDQYQALPEQSVRRLLDSIQRGGQRLQRLVEDFMMLQQIDSGLAQSAWERLHTRVHLASLLETLLEGYPGIEGIDGMPARINLMGARQDLLLDVYSPHVNAALLRILNNAEKFSPEDTVIDINSGVEAGAVYIEIRDRGQGMTEEMLDEACITFAQIDRDTREQQGCGLGLPIARYLTALNRGEMRISRPDDGIGLAVRLSFPSVS